MKSRLVIVLIRNISLSYILADKMEAFKAPEEKSKIVDDSNSRWILCVVMIIGAANRITTIILLRFLS